MVTETVASSRYPFLAIWDGLSYALAKPDELGEATGGARALERPLFCHWGHWVSRCPPIIHLYFLQTLQGPPTPKPLYHLVGGHLAQTLPLTRKLATSLGPPHTPHDAEASPGFSLSFLGSHKHQVYPQAHADTCYCGSWTHSRRSLICSSGDRIWAQMSSVQPFNSQPRVAPA